MKRKFFDTMIAKFAGLVTQEPRVLKFAVENKDHFFSVTELLAMIQPVRTILKTPMAEMFDRLVATEQLNNFAAFYTPEKESLPELLTATNITLDLKQFDNATNVLQHLPLINNKILVNLTSVLKKDRVTGVYSVGAIDNFQNLFVRGQLVAAYNDVENWIIPPVQEFVIRSYSMTISAIISRYYNLSVTEQMSLALYFALFISQLLTPDHADQVAPPILFRCTTLGNTKQIQEVVDICTDASKEGLTILKLCELIAQNGPEKIRKFDHTALNAMCDGLGPDLITSRIALEYPPYWVYILILALSGTAKIPLIYHLNSQRLMNEGRSKFLSQMMTTGAFAVFKPLR